MKKTFNNFVNVSGLFIKSEIKEFDGKDYVQAIAHIQVSENDPNNIQKIRFGFLRPTYKGKDGVEHENTNYTLLVEGGLTPKESYVTITGATFSSYMYRNQVGIVEDARQVEGRYINTNTTPKFEKKWTVDYFITGYNEDEEFPDTIYLKGYYPVLQWNSTEQANTPQIYSFKTATRNPKHIDYFKAHDEITEENPIFVKASGELNQFTIEYDITIDSAFGDEETETRTIYKTEYTFGNMGRPQEFDEETSFSMEEYQELLEDYNARVEIAKSIEVKKKKPVSVTTPKKKTNSEDLPF